MKKIFIVSFFNLISASYVSATPIFLVTPNIHAQSQLITGEQGSAVYQVRNNTQFTLANIALIPPSGITANTGSVSANSQYCTNPFSLAPGASCLLKVNLNSSLLGSGISSGPTVCFSQSKPVYCSQPLTPDQMNTQISQGSIPQDCDSNYANFNYELSQNFDSATDFTTGWGPARNPLSLSPSNPNLTNCATTAGVEWQRKRVIAAAQFWVAQKLNYCHHYNPDYATPVSGRNAGGTAGGYCNPAVDTMPGSVYFGQQARWNYSGQGSETANNWVNNNQMWYGMDCSNTTAFIYNFSFGTIFDSKTGNQAGQCTNIPGSANPNCPSGQNQDDLSPNEQVPSDSSKILNNPTEAGLLVCADGTTDPDPDHPSMCTGHGGYLSGIASTGCFTKDLTPDQIAEVLQPGDLLFIAGASGKVCGSSPDPQPNPDGSKSEVTHVIMWLGKQVGTGPNDINPALIAPDDAPCADPSIWQPHIGDWVIVDSHYQGYDYRVLTSCFYLNDLWGVRRVIN